ncbi:LysR family transcriptional regulator [Kitasatospora sp. GP82]|uniref:LysR family transcriptional regulator n=1 Tax=Kitasatospora sp. GP82 TaxID=3035089 RepID=UPI002476B8C0|nr:LysR family transcriptional regulator [Kitasatospora sp. GP82]MDH6129235.1 DNA-binding transcriptional LysR family regulator [Kitasatospora sp. GP82]
MDLDLRQVRYAVTLADELHFGRAASRLTIAQQTLSAQIRTLEKRLGVPLFTRDRRHVALTPAGETFVERGRRLLADAERLVDEITHTPAPLRIDVVNEGLPSTLLIHHLRTQTPDLPFEVVQGHGMAAALPRLLTGDLDLAFGRPYGLGRPLGTSIATMPVGLDPIGVIVPTDHPLAARDVVPLAALTDHPLLVHTADESAEWRDWVDQAVAAFGLKVATRVRGHGRTSALAAVRAFRHPAFGLTTGHLPDGLTARPLVDPVPLYCWHAVWNTATAPLAINRALELIHTYARTHHGHRPPVANWWLPNPDRDTLQATN